MKSTKNLILYKNFENGKLFYNMAWIMENYENEYYNREDIAVSYTHLTLPTILLV